MSTHPQLGAPHPPLEQQLMAPAGGMSGRRWNSIADEIARWALELSDRITAELLADGYPPGAEPADDYTQFRALVAMAQSGDPRFWNSPDAQERLTQLTYRYGRPGELQQPLAEALPIDPAGIARAAWFAREGASP